MTIAETQRTRRRLACEQLEDRAVPATVALAAGVLTINGTAGDDRIRVFTDGSAIRVLDGTVEIGAFSPASVTSIVVNSGAGNDAVIIDPNLSQPVTFTDPADRNKFVAGGGAANF